MTVDTAITQTLAQMPEELKKEVLHYARYLITQYSDQDDSLALEAAPKKRSGILKGAFVLPLSDDFDEPLDDFAEYMS